MSHLVFTLAAVAAAITTGPALAAQDASASQGDLTGVVISEVSHRQGGGGQFVELYNRGTGPQDAIDLSGWVLITDSGAALALPNSLTLPSERFLVLDLAGGAIIGSMSPSYGALSVGTAFNNDFFPSVSGDALALIDGAGAIRDAVVYASSPATAPNGAIAQWLSSEGEWDDDGPVLDPGSAGSLSRKLLAIRDVNNAEQWRENAYGRTTPGYLYPSAGATDSIIGRVHGTGNVIGSARVSIDALGLSTFTDSDGNYELSPVPEGAHTIMVEAPNFIPTWERLDDKAPHRNASIDVRLTPFAGNAIQQVIEPTGSLVIDPAGRFAVLFPAGFVSQPTTLSFSHVNEESQPRTAGSLGGLATMQGGSLYVFPHVESATPGVLATVALRIYGDHDERPPFNAPVFVETISPNGIPEMMAPGYVAEIGTDTPYAVFSVAHFCHASIHNTGLVYVGPEPTWGNMGPFFDPANWRNAHVRDGGGTADVNGDGELDGVADTLLADNTLRNGACWSETVTKEVSVTEVSGGSWELSGEFEAEPGWLTRMVASGKIKIGGKVGGSSSTSTSHTVSVSKKVEICAPQEGCVEVELWAKYRKYEVWLTPISQTTLPEDPGPPDSIILVPVGIEQVDTDC